MHSVFSIGKSKRKSSEKRQKLCQKRNSSQNSDEDYSTDDDTNSHMETTSAGEEQLWDLNADYQSKQYFDYFM